MKRLLKKPSLTKTTPVIPEKKPGESPLTETAFYPASCISDVLCVTEIANAEFFVGDLFRRRFNTPSFPDTPRHFVAFYKSGERTMMPVGYVHQSPWECCFMCGGLVIDERFYRTIPAAHRRIIREAGGIAEHLLRESFAAVHCEETLAIWGFVGDKLAEQVDLRVGFVHSGIPHLMVVWLKSLPEEEKTAWIRKVAALGPF
ncbi:MAG: hypothetical protein FWC42_03295 [Proteobacteria bacterium]|nr:hypothetical protein [Pseudomonadota bacterium]